MIETAMPVYFDVMMAALCAVATAAVVFFWSRRRLCATPTVVVEVDPTEKLRRMQAARERAQKQGEADIARERERQSAKAAAAVAVEKAKLDERLQRTFGSHGHRLGGGDPDMPPTHAGTTADGAAFLRRDDGSGARELLPRLPGSDRDRYIPFNAHVTDRGYRPTRKAPPGCGGR